MLSVWYDYIANANLMFKLHSFYILLTYKGKKETGGTYLWKKQCYAELW